MKNARTLRDWLFFPTEEELVCKNDFHEIVKLIFEGAEPTTYMEPILVDQSMAALGPQLNPNSIEVKVAQLMRSHLILLGGDVIYVREGTKLHTLGDSVDLLSYYMHTDTRDARKAMDLLETNFQGYFPIIDNTVARNVIRIRDDNFDSCVDLKTLEAINDVAGFPEYGDHTLTASNIEALQQFFAVLNDAVGEPYFFEKTMMYHFNQPYREKSHVLVGSGGNGKSMFMGLVKRLYEDFALTDAPQPNFTGHAAAVIAYSFIGKRVVTFNDVGDPSAKFLEWLKRMITGNLEVKTPTGSWLSVPCNTNFMMETNYVPQILALEAHRRRFIIRSFPEDFRLKDHLSDDVLDRLGDRGTVNAGDIVYYMLSIADKVDDWSHFGTEPEVDTEGGKDGSTRD